MILLIGVLVSISGAYAKDTCCETSNDCLGNQVCDRNQVCPSDNSKGVCYTPSGTQCDPNLNECCTPSGWYASSGTGCNYEYVEACFDLEFPGYSNGGEGCGSEGYKVAIRGKYRTCDSVGNCGGSWTITHTIQQDCQNNQFCDRFLNSNGVDEIIHECRDNSYAPAEICNGMDDDCDSLVDENNPESGQDCGTDVGECSTGLTHCSSGNIICIGNVGPTNEVLDGLDNDCDGIVDDGVSKITTEYDGIDNMELIRITDEMGIVIETKKDLFGNLVQLTEAKDTIDETNAHYEYSILGQLKKIIDPENHETTNTFNTLGQLTDEDHPDTGHTNLVYDIRGNLIESTDALERLINRTYDDLNRIKQIKWVDYYGNDDLIAINYLYDNECGNAAQINSIGRVCMIIDSSGTIQFVYDERGRITREIKTIESVDYITDYGYNNAGSITFILYPSEKKVKYNYNNLQQLESVELDADNDGVVDNIIMSDYDYNPTGTIDKVDFGNGLTTNYQYNERDWLDVIDSGSVFQRSYNYDKAGNIVNLYGNVDKTNQIAEFDYDNLNRLTDVDSDTIGDKSYTYDGVGNRLKLIQPEVPDKQYSYNYESQVDPDYPQSIRLMSVSGGGENNINLQYDAVGNLISDENNDYDYDYDNRLISVTMSDGTVEEYVYDYLGNRIKKTSGNDTTIYLYDLGSTLIEEIAPSTGPVNPIGFCNPAEFDYTSKFLVQDSSSNNLLMLDQAGQLMLKGDLFENSVSSADSNDFKIQDNVGNAFAFISNPEGDLHLLGELFKDSEQNPQSGQKEFIIQSSSGETAAFFDQSSGNLYIKGCQGVIE